MAITIHQIKSCCGQQALIVQMDKPIKKSHLKLFEDAKFILNDSFIQAGIFHVRSGGLTAYGSFGATKLSVICQNNQKKIDEFVEILKKASL